MRHAPAPGYRDWPSGAQRDVGYYGFGWSSTTSGIGGLALNFLSQNLASSTDYRALGFQLRCLSE